MPKDQKKAIYTEIAQAAGVSISTVSRVLRNRDLVHPDTCAKVLTAMESFGYSPSELDYQPKRGGGKVIVLNLPSLENPFYSEIVRGAKAAAKGYGHKLVVNVEHINKETFPDVLDLLKKIKAEGLITLNHIASPLLEQLLATLPMVQCCEYDPDIPATFVSIDDIAASRMAMKHILSTGMRRVALINGPSRYKYARHRQEGYLAALQEADIPVERDWMIQLPEINYTMAVSAITRLLDSPNPPNALFAASDVFAAAGVRAAANRRLSIPQSLVIVGFDNVDFSSTANPAITTVSQPQFQLGYSACELLVERLNNPSAPHRQILLDTELVVRESTRRDR